MGETEEIFWDCLSDGEGEIGNLGQISGQIPNQISDQNPGQISGQFPNLMVNQNLDQNFGQILNQILNLNLGPHSGQILIQVFGENHVQILDIGLGVGGGDGAVPPPWAEMCDCSGVRKKKNKKKQNF